MCQGLARHAGKGARQDKPDKSRRWRSRNGSGEGFAQQEEAGASRELVSDKQVQLGVTLFLIDRVANNMHLDFGLQCGSQKREKVASPIHAGEQHEVQFWHRQIRHMRDYAPALRWMC